MYLCTCAPEITPLLLCANANACVSVQRSGLGDDALLCRRACRHGGTQEPEWVHVWVHQCPVALPLVRKWSPLGEGTLTPLPFGSQ